MTLNIYAADHTNPLVPAPGALVGTVTQTVTVPFRPAADPTCTASDGTPEPTAWRDTSGNCFNGKASNVTFSLTSLHLTVPNDIIFGVAYNTTDHGYAPLGGSGGPYDSLNVGVGGSTPAEIFINSTWAGLYTDGGASGTGFFRQDTGWSGFEPQIKITAH
jgi:hypothetical protein